jgi:type II secretory pathway pseudopilin PulG
MMQKLRTSKLHRGKIHKAAGFTIIELMIAALVFSMVLILITYGVIRFNQAYYGGIIQTDTQNVAHTVIDNISQAIQFDGGTVTTGMKNGNWSGLCVGSQFYQYQLGKQLVGSGPGADQTLQALVLETNVSACSGQTPGASLNGTELLGEHMRLADLEVTPIGGTNLYKVYVRVVYGDDDLLCAQSVPGSCSNPNSTNGATAKDAQCKYDISNPAFCAEADLSTTVQQRVTN